nr:MAG TPA: hypothetical protein [Caudoviricetes sp.]
MPAELLQDSYFCSLFVCFIQNIKIGEGKIIVIFSELFSFPIHEGQFIKGCIADNHSFIPDSIRIRELCHNGANGLMAVLDVLRHLLDHVGRNMVHLDGALAFPSGGFVLLASFLYLVHFFLYQVHFGLEGSDLRHVVAVNPYFPFGAGHYLLSVHRIHLFSPPLNVNRKVNIFHSIQNLDFRGQKDLLLGIQFLDSQVIHICQFFLGVKAVFKLVSLYLFHIDIHFGVILLQEAAVFQFLEISHDSGNQELLIIVVVGVLADVGILRGLLDVVIDGIHDIHGLDSLVGFQFALGSSYQRVHSSGHLEFFTVIPNEEFTVIDLFVIFIFCIAVAVDDFREWRIGSGNGKRSACDKACNTRCILCASIGLGSGDNLRIGEVDDAFIISCIARKYHFGVLSLVFAVSLQPGSHRFTLSGHNGWDSQVVPSVSCQCLQCISKFICRCILGFISDLIHQVHFDAVRRLYIADEGFGDVVLVIIGQFIRDIVGSIDGKRIFDSLDGCFAIRACMISQQLCDGVRIFFKQQCHNAALTSLDCFNACFNERNVHRRHPKFCHLAFLLNCIFRNSPGEIFFFGRFTMFDFHIDFFHQFGSRIMLSCYAFPVRDGNGDLEDIIFFAHPVILYRVNLEITAACIDAYLEEHLHPVHNVHIGDFILLRVLRVKGQHNCQFFIKPVRCLRRHH